MKRIKRFLLVLVTIALLSGCVKNNITTKINNDKSMNLEIVLLTRDEYKNTLSNTVDTNALESRGFKVTTTNENDYSGYKITRTFKNIDELSHATKETVDISDILESTFDFNKLFVRKAGFFKDTYTANFIYSASKLKNRYSLYGLPNEEQMEELELKYTLILPNKVGNNDADEVSTDKKYLTWKLSMDEDEAINYTFEMTNTTNIIILAGGVVLLIIIIIVLAIVMKKKKASKATLIYKEYDPSIEKHLDKSEVIEGEATPENPIQVSKNVIQTGELPKPQTPVVDEPQVVEQTPAPVAEAPATPEATPVETAPVEEAPVTPEVETVVDNMEIPSIQDLEFEVPPEVLEKQRFEELESDKLEIKPNTYDYHRRPDFVKSMDPAVFVEEKATATEEATLDVPMEIEGEPAVVSTEAPQPPAPEEQTFLVSDQKMFNTGEPKKPVSAPVIDVPDAIALSDMPENK